MIDLVVTEVPSIAVRESPPILAVKHVLITDLDTGELLVLDAATRKEIQRIKDGKTPEGILMLKDGARAYVCVAGGDRIAKVDLRRCR